MTKSEIIYTIQSEFSDVLRVEVRTADDDPNISAGLVFIWITVDVLTSADDVYDLKVRIGTALERVRPAGVGFEVVVKRSNESFIPMSSTSRWAAIAAELTTEISPLKKPSVVVPKLNAPRLFEQVIAVSNGIPSPCPTCGCQAFTPDNAGRCVCRGCPLPGPVYGIEAGVSTKTYKCSACGKASAVTMTMGQINLYCDGCRRLAIHQVQVSRVISGAKATFTFNNVKVEGLAEDIEFEPIMDDAIDAGKMTADKLDKGYSITMVTQSEGLSFKDLLGKIAEQMPAGSVKTSWVTAVGRLGVIPTEAETTAATLLELFRDKLGLQPFQQYAANQVAQNAMRRDVRESDWVRRTGRTTLGMLRAIAEFMTRPDLVWLCTVGLNETYSKALAKEAIRLYELLDLPRQMLVKPLMPIDFDPRYDYTRSQKCWVYVDHSYDERRR